MTINIDYNTYKFCNCSENKIEISTDTLIKLNLPKEELYKNRSKTEGFN